MRDRPGACAPTRLHTHKMATKTSGLPVELSVSLFDSFSECICSKGSSSIGYRVNWCINHCLQSNQFVGRCDEEEEEEKKDGENRGLTDFRV